MGPRRGRGPIPFSPARRSAAALRVLDMMISANSDVVSCTLGSGAALLDLRTGTYFSVNDTGAKVWSLMGQQVSFEDLTQRMLEAYAVDADILRNDLQALVQELSSRGLVSIVEHHERDRKVA